jgi:hypothetical protein
VKGAAPIQQRLTVSWGADRGAGGDNE